MELSARFVGIWMVFVICIVVCVEGVNFGEDCSINACTEADTICNPGTPQECICNIGFFRKDATSCAAQIGLTETCTAGQPTDQCEDANAECDATALTCGCKAAHFVNTAGACDRKIGLTEACEAGQPADQCADDNAECDDTAQTCGCKAAHFVNKDGSCDPKIGLTETCTAGQPTDQCEDANAECDATALTCGCKAAHFVNTAGACDPRKYPDATCGGDECVINASCVETKCACDADYTPSPTVSPTMCNGVVKITSLTHLYVVPFLVSLMFLLR